MPARAQSRSIGTGRPIAVSGLVFLRLPRESDRAEFLALREASRRFLAPWEATPTADYDPFSPRKFDDLLRARRSRRARRFLICECETGRIAGAIALGEIVRGAFQSCYLGYWIGKPFARRGYMTEAARLALTHAFDTLGLHRVEANIIPRNAASIGLVKKLGFRFEGTARRYLRINHKWQDHEHWAMTVEDWRQHDRSP